MDIQCLYDKVAFISELKPHPKNRNQHPKEQIQRLAEILKYQGWRYPVKVSRRSGFVTSGHGRIEAAKLNGWVEVPVNYQVYESEEQEYADVVADNAIASWSELDLSGINTDIGDLGPDFNIDLLGIEDFLVEPAEKLNSDGSLKGNMNQKFIVPPFSVLDARQGYWKERKSEWLELGLDSVLGRKPDLLMDNQKGLNRILGDEDAFEATSIFDPVLCELVYRWFSNSDAIVLDPFAGGSVRGIVASKTGRQYIGIDLRPEQVEANREQAKSLCDDPLPVWHSGDSRNILDYCKGVEADLIFSCPPYGDLEIYSDDPRDLSNMAYPQFIESYRDIIAHSVQLLKPNRFACFVVGEIRQNKRPGFYRNFVMDTIKAFQDAGAYFYNEAIFVTAVGTLALRAGKTFLSSRKLGKTHQNVLVFCKGDAFAAAATCGTIEVHMPEGGEELVSV